MPTTDNVTLTSPNDLDDLLSQACAEQWSQLTFWGAAYSESYVRQRRETRPNDNIFRLSADVDELASRLASLDSLTSLDLRGNGIGDDGATAIAALENLTSLDLSHNSIGDDGAKAIAALQKLTSLDLSNNSIGDEGATAISALKNLTSLNLWDNNIGDEGAKAIAALKNLTSLDLDGNSIGDEGANAIAVLENLTSLVLDENEIGTDGAQAIAALHNLVRLGLSNNSIGEEGAQAIAALKRLTSLDMDGNSIRTEGAHAIATLHNLTELNLSYNGIGDEGAKAIAALQNLTSVTLAGNSIGVDGARAIAALSNLTVLELWDNDIGDGGARAIATLDDLRSLNLGDNNIGENGARAISALNNLTELYLWRNNIGPNGARAISTLENLTSLYLNSNSIGGRGAMAITALNDLTSLDLSGNRIGKAGARQLLDSLSDHRRAGQLFYLDVQKNNGFDGLLPAEALQTTDAQAILAAYRRFIGAAERATLRPLNEAKLLVVGNEAVGKTSLIKYLIRDEPRDPGEEKTPGAAIHEQIETQHWSEAESGISLNVWDFGGQEIMHGTHRYFLTERSLYLVVLEDRREDDDSIFKWLKTIQNRGGDSPIIVVINKSDRGKSDLRLNQSGLQQEYPNIAGFLRTSCDATAWAAESIAALRHLVAETLANDKRLEHIRDPIPASWLHVKNAIAAMARDRSVLPFATFQQLCEVPANEGSDIDEPITDPDEQRALLRVLHELGVVVAHGLERDAPAAMREITLLDPNWLTGAIYWILTEPTVRDQGGEFARAQLANWLDATAYPPERHEFILSMMQDPDIGLCFDLPGAKNDHFLIPEVLPPNAPDYGNWPVDSLHFRYRYKLLPRGLIPRFIVQAHENLTDQPTRWRTGAVLQAAGCRILVNGGQQQIDIAVDGPQNRRRAALNVILNHLEAAHAQNPGIGAEARVPVPDQLEVDVSYDHLLTLEEEYGPDYSHHADGATNAYRVQELLDGVRRDRSRPEEWGDDRRGHHVIGGRIAGADDRVELGGRTAPQQPAVPAQPESPRSSTFTSWRFFSIACGVAAMLFAIVLYLLPSMELRIWVGVLAGIGLFVTMYVQSRNPARYYRRALNIVIPGGLLLQVGGGALDVYAATEPALGWFRWDGGTSGIFFVAWAAVVGVLVWADLKQTR